MINQYVIYNPQGGTEGHSQEYTTNLCNGLAENGVKVDLVTSRDFDPAEVIKKGVSVTFTSISDSRKRTVKYDSWLSKLRYGAFIIANNFWSLWLLDRLLMRKKKSACILIGGETITNILYLLITFWRSDSVLAQTIHNADYEISLYRNDKVKLVYKVVSRFLLGILLKTPVVIFVHGEAMQLALARQLGVSPKRISIYKVPLKKVDVVQAGSPGLRDPVRLLFGGVVRHDKGFDILCEALSKCAVQHPWQLRIAGSVRQVGEDYVYGISKNFGIDAHCSYNLKYLSSSDLDKEFQNADIVVLPYRLGFIAQSVVMTDAVRWKKPVIVTEHSQNGYDAKRYRVGWVFKSENMDSLIEALNTAIKITASQTLDFGFNEFIESHSPFNVAKCIIEATSV